MTINWFLILVQFIVQFLHVWYWWITAEGQNLAPIARTTLIIYVVRQKHKYVQNLVYMERKITFANRKWIGRLASSSLLYSHKS